MTFFVFVKLKNTVIAHYFKVKPEKFSVVEIPHRSVVL
jgi:hypothetical protein